MPEGSPSDIQVRAIFYGDSLKWFRNGSIYFTPLVSPKGKMYAIKKFSSYVPYNLDNSIQWFM